MDIDKRHYDAGEGPAEQYERDAVELLDAVGISRSASSISATVQQYIDGATYFRNKITPFGLYLLKGTELNAEQLRTLAERTDLRWLLTYEYPTGETAIRNVMREEH